MTLHTKKSQQTIIYMQMDSDTRRNYGTISKAYTRKAKE